MNTSKLYSFILLSFLISNISLLPASHAAAEKCRWKENCDCKTPGATLRWEYAYCMAKLGVTDAKEGIDKLNKCSRKSMPSDYDKMTPCAKNQFWRTERCKLNGGSECLTSDKEIPEFIEKGS